MRTTGKIERLELSPITDDATEVRFVVEGFNLIGNDPEITIYLSRPVLADFHDQAERMLLRREGELETQGPPCQKVEHLTRLSSVNKQGRTEEAILSTVGDSLVGSSDDWESAGASPEQAKVMASLEAVAAASRKEVEETSQVRTGDQIRRDRLIEELEETIQRKVRFIAGLEAEIDRLSP